MLKGWIAENDGLHIQKCYLIDRRRNYTLDKDCVQTKSCISCLWKRRPIFRVRGLCRKSTIERYYTFVHFFNYDGIIGNLNMKFLVVLCMSSLKYFDGYNSQS